MSAALQNRFLTALSPDTRESLLSGAVEVKLPIREVLYEAESSPQYAWFLHSGIASVVAVMPDGAAAEVGLIGYEGVVGGLHLLGPGSIPTQCFVQLEATALRIPWARMRKAFHASDEVRDRVLEYVQSQASSLGQLAACHRLHEAEERLARWLLMAQDRTQSDTLHLTQEFLAMMLGARRTTVTLVAGSLQRSGLIEYQRGRVKIPNRANLEAAACECYQVTKQLFQSLYTQNLSTSWMAAGDKQVRNGVEG